MRELSSGLAAHLVSGITTLCQCWRLTRRDGVVLGFTEHDRDLDFEGTRFHAASGFRPSEAEAETGLAASGGTVTGGFSSYAITQADLSAGRYDGARVEVFLVNWQDPAERVLLRVEDIGEVTSEGGAFTAELRSLAQRLSQERGRIHNRRCDASLGDARCKVATAAWRGEGVVASADAGTIHVEGLADFDAGFFDRGTLEFISGVAQGVRVDVESTEKIHGSTRVALWMPLDVVPVEGDRVVITAGCDKTFATCRNRFHNQDNFRGFPHMPGSDFAYSYADGETVHDGSPLYD